MSIPQEGKMGQTWFQNRSIEIEVVRSDRFRDPIALTIAVQKFLRRAFVTLFWPLHAIINYNINKQPPTNQQHNFTTFAFVEIIFLWAVLGDY